MSTALASDSYSLALELHAFVRSLDPARYRDELAASLQERLDALSARFHALAEEDGGSTLVSLQVRLDEVSEIMASYAPSAGRREEWIALGKQLTPAYEALAASLSDYQLHCPNIRPSNWTRSAFHMTSATGVVLLIELVLDPSWFLPITVPALILALSMEISRRFVPRINDLLMWLFSTVAHPHEAHRVNSATWYTSAMVVLSLIGSPMIGAVAVAILGFADPAAAIFGRRYGKTKLANGRSLEGTSAFIVVGTLVAFAVMAVFHPHVGLAFAFGAAFVAALIAGLAELYATYVDDNLAIPAAAAVGMLLAQWLSAF
ncbi:MAG: hypothetical protein EP330_22700 [Deltaproteobacteria bacterium]|nr:MAG: hypothetical protein EP330_22700 [Deltaproteobacteria bacterium]